MEVYLPKGDSYGGDEEKTDRHKNEAHLHPLLPLLRNGRCSTFSVVLTAFSLLYIFPSLFYTTIT